MRCGQVKTSMKGIFCANFVTPRGGWQACESVWCGECYTAPQGVTFHGHQPVDEEGYHWGKAGGDKHHHQEGMVTTWLPPQCILCIFRILTVRNPGPHDNFLLDCIRQVNLDALAGTRHC